MILSNLIANLLIAFSSIATPLGLLVILSSQRGVEFYGQVMALSGFTFLFVVLCDLGLPMELTRRLSGANDKATPSQLVASYVLIKVLLTLATLPVVALVFIYSMEGGLFTLLAVALLYASLSLNVIWYFQGRERLFKYSCLTAGGKVAQLVLVTILALRGAEPGVCLLGLALPNLAVLFVGLWLIVRDTGKIVFTYSRDRNLSLLSGSFAYYFARSPLLIFENSSVFFASQLMSQVDVGLYAIATQIYRGFSALTAGVSVTLLPYLNRTKNMKPLVMYLIMLVGFYIVLLSVVNFGHEGALAWLLAWLGSPSIELVSLVLVSSLLYAVASVLGYPYLVAINRTKSAHVTIFVSSLLYYPILLALGLLGPLSPYIMFSAITVSIFFLAASRLTLFFLHGRGVNNFV